MSRLVCEEWRSAAPSTVAPLYDAEVHRWSSIMNWDARSGFGEVEKGRRRGHVRGWIVKGDFGAVEGWCYYILHKGTLQIGGFTARTQKASELMLAAIHSDPDVAEATGTTFFGFSDAPSLAQSLRANGLAVDRYWYYSRELQDDAPPLVRDARRWSAGDEPAAVELMMRAYPGADDARPFAPRGTKEEWTDYVRQIVTARGCGELLPDASVSVAYGPGRIAGVALVSRIATSTAHLVQLAIDPDTRRRGYGHALVALAMSAAHRAGCRRFTLLVSGRNTAARKLYESMGFEAVASFVAGGANQPRRLTSVAAGGLAAIRR